MYDKPVSNTFLKSNYFSDVDDKQLAVNNLFDVSSQTNNNVLTVEGWNIKFKAPSRDNISIIQNTNNVQIKSTLSDNTGVIGIVDNTNAGLMSSSLLTTLNNAIQKKDTSLNNNVAVFGADGDLKNSNVKFWDNNVLSNDPNTIPTNQAVKQALLELQTLDPLSFVECIIFSKCLKIKELSHHF